MFDILSPGLSPALAVPFGLLENSYGRLTHLVQRMGQQALEFRGPDGQLNSTATLLAHIARADLEYLHAIMGQRLSPELKAEYGPYQTSKNRLPDVTGKTAAELLERCRRVIEMGREYLATKGEEEAERPVQIPWWPQPATVRYVLWHMAGHSMFHQGQIRRLQEWYNGQ